jgi:hypothetical protein
MKTKVDDLPRDSFDWQTAKCEDCKKGFHRKSEALLQTAYGDWANLKAYHVSCYIKLTGRL